MFALFTSIQDFTNWHNEVCLRLGYPIVGVNQLTNEPDLENVITDFTDARINPNDSRVIAYVGDESTGLTTIDPSAAEWADWFKYYGPDQGF
jgi:hypothetical protein